MTFFPTFATGNKLPTATILPSLPFRRTFSDEVIALDELAVGERLEILLRTGESLVVVVEDGVEEEYVMAVETVEVFIAEEK